MNTEIRATKTGFTDIISLPEGIFNLFLGSETWGSANIQVSGDGVHWFTLQKDDANLVISNNFASEINGGSLLRLNVISYSKDIHAVVKRVL